jgi:uncharacterized Zn finger protein
MAKDRLHIICGTCGAGKEDLSFEIVRDGVDLSDEEKYRFEDAVYIWCSNCGTLHDLSNHVKKKS